MHWKPALIEFWETARHWLEPYLPGAVGAAIVQIWEPDLRWRDRTAQWVVGLSFAVFIVPGIGHTFGWHERLTYAVSFVVATVAVKAFRPLRDAAISGSAGGIKVALSNLGSWVPRRGPAAPEPPKPEGEG